MGEDIAARRKYVDGRAEKARKINDLELKEK